MAASSAISLGQGTGVRGRSPDKTVTTLEPRTADKARSAHLPPDGGAVGDEEPQHLLPVQPVVPLQQGGGCWMHFTPLAARSLCPVRKLRAWFRRMHVRRKVVQAAGSCAGGDCCNLSTHARALSLAQHCPQTTQSQGQEAFQGAVALCLLILRVPKPHLDLRGAVDKAAKNRKVHCARFPITLPT